MKALRTVSVAALCGVAALASVTAMASQTKPAVPPKVEIIPNSALAACTPDYPGYVAVCFSNASYGASSHTDSYSVTYFKNGAGYYPTPGTIGAGQTAKFQYSPANYDYINVQVRSAGNGIFFNQNFNAANNGQTYSSSALAQSK